MELSEKQFLITKAIGAYNLQFGRSIKLEDCSIMSIPPDPQSFRAYEISTPDKSPTFRIHMYFVLSSNEVSIPLKVNVDNTIVRNELGDELFVLICRIDRFSKEYGMYQFNHMVSDSFPFGTFTMENAIPFITESGKYMVLERS